MQRLAATLLLLWACGASAAQQPMVAIVLDDMGNDLQRGISALDLPGPVTYAFLPFTPHAQRLARSAASRGREVMLHLPMQPLDGAAAGPGGLSAEMDRAALQEQVRRDLEAVPGVVGVNNHMGSAMTGDGDRMGWLMEVLAERGLFFLDSRTHTDTVAETVAREQGLPSGRRHVFLDNERDEAAIRASFERLLRQASRTGRAVAIAHPYPETLAVLQSELSLREQRGWQLVPVSQILATTPEESSWPVSWSPSPTAAKSSKQSP